MNGKSWVAVTAGVVVCSSVEAAFINGVEDFNGTSVDSATWVPYNSADGSATVADGYLTLGGQYMLATRSLTIGTGTTLSARAMLTAPHSWGPWMMLGLTATPNSPLSGQHAYADLMHTIQGDSMFSFVTNGTGHGTQTMSNNTGTWYRIELTRNTASNYTCELLTDSGLPLYSIDYTYAGLPDEASVFIGLGPNVRFDWVGVPEPAILASAACGAYLLLCRWRRVQER